MEEKEKSTAQWKQIWGEGLKATKFLSEFSNRINSILPSGFTVFAAWAGNMDSGEKHITIALMKEKEEKPIKRVVLDLGKEEVLISDCSRAIGNFCTSLFCTDEYFDAVFGK